MITQETNPVYWACTHCLTLEPWTVIRTVISTFILVVQFDNTIRFATLESVRPGQTAKGSFKNSKSKGKTQVSVPIDYIHAFLFADSKKAQAQKTLKF